MYEERTARWSAARIERPDPLTPESAASVREGAIAVLRHGVRYLPVVDDGTLVGIVAVRELGRVHPGPGDAEPRR